MRMHRILLTLLAVAAMAVITLTCSPGYLLRAGVEEARILSRRRPIPHVIADPATTPETRRRLELVLQARTFADSYLELDAGQSFTTYSWVDSDTLLMVLSAARKERFEPYTWWFPIVGRVPYKGYFDFAEADAAAAELAAAGYDTYVRPSGAFSTLGWFNDPLLNTILDYGDVSLVNTVIHELLHNTLFVPGQVAFNESFANFVGDRGSIAFFCAREGEESERCSLARASWADNLLYGAFLSSLVAELEAVYARTHLPVARRIALREEVFSAARARFRAELEPALRTRSFQGWAEREVNNATLIGTRLYYQRLELFEEVYQRYGGNLAAAIAAMAAAAARTPGAPFEAVAGLLD